MTAAAETKPAKPTWIEAFAVYLKPRVLIVLFLGFSAGLPLALSGSTLRVWMRQSGVDLQTIGLFALAGTPYTIKFLWAPVVDALDVPLFSTLLGRRRDAGHRHRCLPHRKPARKRASGRHGLLRGGLSHRDARLDRGRPVPGKRI